jgi:hypothetical protein
MAGYSQVKTCEHTIRLYREMQRHLAVANTSENSSDLLASHPEGGGDFAAVELSGCGLFGKPASEVGSRELVNGDQFVGQAGE